MIWASVRNSVLHYGLRLVFGGFVLIFIGYIVPISMLGLKVSVLEELILACKLVIDFVVAIVRWDLLGLLKALVQPWLLEPVWLAIGRYALAGWFAGAVMIAVIDITTWPAQIKAAWAEWRLRPRAEPSEATFEDPDDARTRMAGPDKE